MRGHCIVVTRPAGDQPGCLDISNRIGALAKTYRLTVIGVAPLPEEERRIAGVDYVALPCREGLLGWARYLYACAQLIKKRRPERLVLLHSRLTPMLWLLKNVPVALYWNEHPSQFIAPRPDYSFIERFARGLVLKWGFFAAARRASLVMPIAKAHHRDLLHHGCQPGRVKLIYMGVCDSFLHAARDDLPVSEQKFLNLAYIGAANRAQGRNVMLEGLALANQEHRIAHLTIIGVSGDEFYSCLRRALELGIYEDVTLSGPLRPNWIPTMLHDMDAGLCLWEDRPWWRFNLPTQLSEYLVAGLPVLASDIYMHTQYISDGYNGMMFECSAAGLAKAIRELWEKRAALPDLKKNARECGKQYLWSEIEYAFLHAIAELSITGRDENPAKTYDSQMRVTY